MRAVVQLSDQLTFTCNGEAVAFDVEAGESLLDVLRERLGLRSVQDGCAPQGQCGCCTVLVDGAPRVACVTPASRVRGRSVTTVEGLEPERRTELVERLLAHGGSQCGFCTPGIVVRCIGLLDGEAPGAAAVDKALAAHLCRCTGWQGIVEAVTSTADAPPARDLDLASTRATIEGRTAQRVGPDVVLGQTPFASDTAPADALVAISARAQMLMRDAAKQSFEQAPRHAEIIFEQSKRMGTLAQGLMDYTRSTVKLEPMDLNALLTKTMDFVQTDKRFRGVEWDVVLDPEVPQLRGDVGQLQGVFINLFVNAADAMGTQTTRRAIIVRTRLDARTRMVVTTVQDTGPGIKKEHLPRMFEFMFTTKEDGHGFGLSTSYRTVMNHKGRFTVDSPEGSGAHFTVMLPLVAPGASR